MVVFGSEPWTRNILTWERKILRKNIGPKNENCAWRIRTNQILQRMYKDKI